MRVHFTPDARQAIHDKRVWWETNRDKAPGLFVEELRAVLARLRAGSDDTRQHYTTRQGRIIWRTLMPKTKNHVYYRVDEATGYVEVLLVWNAISSKGPLPD